MERYRLSYSVTSPKQDNLHVMLGLAFGDKVKPKLRLSPFQVLRKYLQAEPAICRRGAFQSKAGEVVSQHVV
jgi:hypothetical protein